MYLHNLYHLGTFIHMYTLLKESQWWNKEQIEEYQLQQLKNLLTHAYKNVTYYTKLFNKLELKPEDINSFEDFQKIPYLTKEIVRKNLNTLKANNFPEHRFENLSTGGSTGQPLRFYVEKGFWRSRLLAYGIIQRKWTNRSFFDKCISITGKTSFAYQQSGRTLVLSSFYMNDDYLALFVKKIRKFKPKNILGYPSSITNLAIYMKRKNLEKFSNIKSILCYAETLYGWQRDLIEEIFQCRVYDTYSLREQVALGSTCKHSNYLHMFPEFGIIELIGKDGKPVKKEDEIGEIVGTGFHTYIFPFIRYRTGDMGVYTSKNCQCGRNYPLLKRIEGRTQEFIISKTKLIIPLTGVYELVAKYSTNVKEYQLYQENPGEIIIKIVKGENYTEKDTIKIRESFQKRLGSEFTINVSFVDHITRTAMGKYQFLIQKLPIKVAKK